MNKHTDEYTAVHCRIPTDVYDDMQTVRKISEKSVASYVSAAIITYTGLVKEKNPKQIAALQLDQLAYQLSQSNK